MTESKIKTLIAKQLGLEESSLTLQTKLVEDLGADSLDLLEIVMLIEQSFKITVEEEEYASANTIQKIIELVDSKITT